MGRESRLNKIAQDSRMGVLSSLNKQKERLEYLLNRGFYGLAFKEGLITITKFNELIEAKNSNNKLKNILEQK